MDSEQYEKRRQQISKQQQMICDRLGINSAEATSLTVEIEPGKGKAVVRWENVRRVPLEELADLFGVDPLAGRLAGS